MRDIVILPKKAIDSFTNYLFKSLYTFISIVILNFFVNVNKFLNLINLSPHRNVISF